MDNWRPELVMEVQGPQQDQRWDKSERMGTGGGAGGKVLKRGTEALAE